MTEKWLKRILARSGRGIIYAAHGVAREFKDKAVESVHIPYTDFTEIIEYLRRMEFDFLTAAEVVALGRLGFRHPKHWVHLTFDDGYQNNFDVVYPYLRERKIPFSIYVSTHYIDAQDYLPTCYLRYAESLGKDLGRLLPSTAGLSPEQVVSAAHKYVMYTRIEDFDEVMERVKGLFTNAELAGIREYYNDRPLRLEALKELAADPLVHIGSHSHRHVIMHPGQSPAAMKDEILRSIHLIRDVWKLESEPTFCYPNGDYNEASTAVCRELGFPLVFLTESGFVAPGTYGLRMPRFWMATAQRARLVSHLAAVGNAGIYLFGRKPPAGVGAA